MAQGVGDALHVREPIRRDVTRSGGARVARDIASGRRGDVAIVVEDELDVAPFVPSLVGRAPRRKLVRTPHDADQCPCGRVVAGTERCVGRALVQRPGTLRRHTTHMPGLQ